MNLKNNMAAIGGFMRKAVGGLAELRKWDAGVPRAAVVEALEGRTLMVADLVTTAITGITGTLVPGQTIAGTLTVRNIAITGAAGPSEAMLFLSSDKIFGNVDDISIGSVITTGLAPGKGSVNPFALTLNESIPDGKYYVMARADTFTGIVEFNEENNVLILSVPVTVMRSTLSVTATPAKIAETEGKGTFVLTRGGAPLTVPLSVHIAVDGTATRGVDYVLKVGNEVVTSDLVTIPAKAGSVTVGVFAIGDSKIEGSESVILSVVPSVTSPPAYVVSASKGYGSIAISDDEPTVKLTAASTKMSEDGFVTFTATRSGGSNKLPMTVFLGVVGSAVEGTDFKLVTMDGKAIVGGCVIMGPNVGSVTFKAVGIDDQAIEGEEGFGLFVIDSPGTPTYSIDPLKHEGHIKIIDNEPTVKLSTTATKMNEDGSATFTLARSGGSNKTALTVFFDTFGTAIQGTDYKLVSMDGKTVFGESITLGANAASVTFKAMGIDDQIIEGDESLTVHLANAPGDKTYIIDPLKHEGKVTIIDNEPSVSLTTTTKSTSETKGSATFTVTRTGGSTASALDVYFSSSLTAIQGEDYTLVSADGKSTLSNKVTIPARAGSVTFKALVIDDTKIEGTENIGLSLEEAPGDKTYTIQLLKNAVNVVLYDNEPEVSIKVSSDKSTETKGSVTFTIARALGSTTSPLTVFFNPTGTAQQGQDYVLTSIDGKSTLTDSVVIPAGAASVTFKAQITDDSLIEGSQTLGLQLGLGSGPVTYTINAAKSTTLTTIVDNEPTVSVTASKVSASETSPGTNKGQFKFTRTGGNTASVLTVNFTIANTGIDVATFGQDYTLTGSPASSKLTTAGSDPVTGSITFAAGVTSVMVDVTAVNDDLTGESKENIALTLVDNGTFGLNAGKVTATVGIINGPKAPPAPGSPLSVGNLGSSLVFSNEHDVTDTAKLPGGTGQVTGTLSVLAQSGRSGSTGFAFTYIFGARAKIVTLSPLNVSFDGASAETAGIILTFVGVPPASFSGKTLQFFAKGTAGAMGTFVAASLLSGPNVEGSFKLV